jgi:hypothetical protein
MSGYKVAIGSLWDSVLEITSPCNGIIRADWKKSCRKRGRVREKKEGLFFETVPLLRLIEPL